MTDITHYNITPCPAPRQVKKDTWDPSPPVLRYRAFRDEVKLKRVKVPPEGFTLVFVLPMPKSWTKKKRAAMNGSPHEQKPDRDNLEKALLDSIYGDDSHVWHSDGTTKFWAEEGEIIVITREVPDEDRNLDTYLRARGADQA